jgi:esterase/lipase superfamily enzyme
MGDVKGTKNEYVFYNFMAVKNFVLKHANLVSSKFASTSNFYSKLVYVYNTYAKPAYRDVTSDFTQGVYEPRLRSIQRDIRHFRHN